MSGASFTSRPGIQQLLAHMKRERIDVVLCITFDSLSRDVEHSSTIIKELNCYGYGDLDGARRPADKPYRAAYALHG